MGALGRRPAVALAAALVAFALAFAVARAVAGGDEASDPAPVQDLPAATVSIENLERAPTIKPMRSVLGERPFTQEPSSGHVSSAAGLK
jgi:hypothetical protein